MMIVQQQAIVLYGSMFCTHSCCPHAAKHVSLLDAFGLDVYLAVFTMVVIENPLPSRSWITSIFGIMGLEMKTKKLTNHLCTQF